MSESSDQDTMVPSVPTVAAFDAKLRSLWGIELPSEAPLADLNDLEAVLAAHATWVQSIENPATPMAGRRACLRNQDLRGVNLARRDLRGADLSLANLEGACLEGALLTLADLSGTILRNADLRGPRLRRADLSGAVMDGAKLGGSDFD